MKSRVVSVIALLAIVLALPSSLLADSAEARANLHQINGSKVKAKLVLLDTGGQVVISGVAQGLDPSQSYISLAYDSDSIPSGPNACTPTSSAPGFVGQWNVNADGSGALAASLPGASLAGIGTMSIRVASTMALQACGDVTPDD